MVDPKSIEATLQEVRLARLDAEAATTDVEEMILQVQHIVPGRGRLFFFVEGPEEWSAAA